MLIGARLHLGTSLCYAGFRFCPTPEIRDRPVKRPLFLRCLIVLLALALASGNAHAALHLDAAHHAPCPDEHAHHHGKTEPQHRHDKGLACCCDCLGCSAAVYLSHPLTVTPADLAARVHYDAMTASLPGRALRPDPGPPRTGTLS
jgi:hypothetical protein